MKIFLDTEFYENGEKIYPISFGAVTYTGKYIYLINPKVKDEKFLQAIKKDCEKRGSMETWEFLMMNVFNNLGGEDKNYVATYMWPELLQKYAGDKPEFWASTCAYDWVLTAQLFGRMMDLPEKWPKRCNDTSQLKAMFPQVKVDKKLAVPDMSQIGEHNALYDAYETRAKFLSYERYVKSKGLESEILL